MTRSTHRNSQDSQVERNDVEENVLSFLAKKGPVSVSEVYEALGAQDSSLTRAKLVDAVRVLAEQGRTELQDIPQAVNSLGEYLLLWERNLWFYGSLALSFAALLAVLVVPPEFPFVAIRWLLGSLFVLFIPGYVTVEGLFTRRQLDSTERLALSVTLSLVLIPLMSLLLNYTPWGITLTSILTALTLLTVGLSLIALIRNYGESKVLK